MIPCPKVFRQQIRCLLSPCGFQLPPYSYPEKPFHQPRHLFTMSSKFGSTSLICNQSRLSHDLKDMKHRQRHFFDNVRNDDVQMWLLWRFVYLGLYLNYLLLNFKWRSYHAFFVFFPRHLGLDLVPRKEFEMVDEDQISVSDLYKMVRHLFRSLSCNC